MKNKLKTLSLTVVGLCLICGTSQATTTLVFSSASGRLSGFADTSGVPANNMRWGLVIDTAGDGFDNTFPGTTYDAFANNVSGFINTTTLGVSSTSDDYFFTPSALPVTADAAAGSGETGTQVGAITSAVGAPNGTDGLIPGVTTGDKFAVIWFPVVPAADSRFGLYQNPTVFSLPASGTSVNLSANFSGNDPIRTADFTFTGVPEPSRTIFACLGLLGCAMRRRRS